MNLLDVENLWVRFPTRSGIFDAVRGISFSIGKERLGIVGESGSGKSMTGRAILRLIRPPGMVTADRIAIEGDDILGMSEAQMRAVRGQRISMIMQDPKFSLNPVMSVGAQIVEAYRLHANVTQAEARSKALEMLEAVAIRDAEVPRPGSLFDATRHPVVGVGARDEAELERVDPEALFFGEPFDQRVACIASARHAVRPEVRHPVGERPVVAFTGVAVAVPPEGVVFEFLEPAQFVFIAENVGHAHPAFRVALVLHDLDHRLHRGPQPRPSGLFFLAARTRIVDGEHPAVADVRVVWDGERVAARSGLVAGLAQ